MWNFSRGSFLSSFWNCHTSRRRFASYDTHPISHEHLLKRATEHSISASCNSSDESLLLAVEAVERVAAQWRLNKWEFRVPLLLSPVESEEAKRQLHYFKRHIVEQCDRMAAVSADKAILSAALNVNEFELIGKNRSWFQEKIESLRWEGKITLAKEARDAWVRLEQYGAQDYRLLERACVIYGMARSGAFKGAFGNYVVEDPITKKATFARNQDPFESSVFTILSIVPTLDIVYDFLGFGGTQYHGALRRYLRIILEASHGTQTSNLTSSNGKIVFKSPQNDVILFDMTEKSLSEANDPDHIAHGVGDFIYINGGDMTIFTITNLNKWQRKIQIPGRRQLEGIARRMCLSRNIPHDQVKIRVFCLPPNIMDKSSLGRIHRAVGLTQPLPELVKAGLVPSWVSLYDRELNADDLSYLDIQKSLPEEEWVTL